MKILPKFLIFLDSLLFFSLSLSHSQIDETPGHLKRVHAFKGPNPALDPIRLVHVKLEEGGPLNHFNRLEVDPFQEDVKEIRQETIQERDEESGYVYNLPLGTARELYQAIENFNEWIEQRNKLLRHAPWPQEETFENQRELEEILAQKEVKEALETLQQAAESIKEPLEKMAAAEQKRASPKKPRAQAKPTAKNTPPQEERRPTSTVSPVAINWEAFNLPKVLKVKEGFEKPQPPLSVRGQVYDKIAHASDVIERVAQQNPRLAKTLDAVTTWGATVLQAWVYVETAAGLLPGNESMVCEKILTIIVLGKGESDHEKDPVYRRTNCHGFAYG